MPGILASILAGCGLRDLLPGPPVLSPAERSAFEASAPSPVTYTGPARVPYPVLPVQVWGLRYGLDIVIESQHPDWMMHEYARIDLPSGPLWIAKDADRTYLQTITSNVPDLQGWVPEIPVPRHEGAVDVIDASAGDSLDLRFAYTNPRGEAVTVHYEGPTPTKPSQPRNGNTMGHSRQSLAALLDLHLFRPGGRVAMTIGGVPVKVRKLWGIYPMKFALAQTQGGLAIADFRQTATDTGFRVVRPSQDRTWPTHAEEDWTETDGWVRHEGRVVSLRYHFVAGELTRAQAWQAGVAAPVADIVFNPRLPDLRRPFAGTVSASFAADIAGQAGHGTGAVHCRWEADTAVCETRPSAPPWFADRPMDTRIRYDGTDAIVTIARVGAS